ncbi:MAG: Maf family nucleotide pyrophosphatase [Cytophagaceae bacterium]|nr:Maf family nucleotide pyrophosphatase [Cytophagaceae bacterium]MDW8457299.1 Maf family nucleotide pyrophosphatase [Cytophagaceae bacterium]
MKSIILASNSPRRKQLMEGAGLSFTVKTVPVEEVYPSSLPVHEVAEYLAMLKAKPFKDNISENEIVITADTVVIVDHTILGKPQHREEAISMLTKLSARTHEVITGVCITTKERQINFSEKTEVHFTALSPQQITYYVDTYKPYDKAGAYGIQEYIGYIAIEKIIGSFYNVMGLPIHRVVKELQNLY